MIAGPSPVDLSGRPDGDEPGPSGPGQFTGPDSRPADPFQAMLAEAGNLAHMQALRAIAAALGHLLRQQPWARDKLRMHAGAVVCIGLQTTLPPPLPAPEIRLLITADGFLEPADEQAAPRASLLLKPSFDVLRSLSQEGVEGLARHLRVEGDVMLAATLGELARHLRWEAEEDLSRLVGDVAARRAVGWFREGIGLLRTLVERPADALNRRMASGQGPVADKASLLELAGQLRSIDERLQGLERRADQLASSR